MNSMTATWVMLFCSGIFGLKSDNFLVHCQDKNLQKNVSHYAEVYRRDIARQWIGQVQPKWYYPHIINTCMGEPHGQNNNLCYVTHMMVVNNLDEDQILYSTLPHEVCHSVLMTHCGLRLPLWASEGIAMTCERTDMGAKDPGRFSRQVENLDIKDMFEWDSYPIFYRNAFYGQAYSVTVFLVEKSNKKTFLKFVQEGHVNGWEQALERSYATSFERLQVEWWVWHQGRFPNCNKDVK